jgi:hypothetical protein
VQDVQDSNKIRIYTKFFVHDRKAIELFCFSCPDEWILAAQIISRTVNDANTPDLLGGPDWREELLQMPLYRWTAVKNGGDVKFHGFLLLAIDKIRPEDLFWSLGMEVVMILMNGYNPTKFCSEGADATQVSYLAAFVYASTRMLLSDHIHCDRLVLPGNRRGARSLMHAIEDTARSAKHPHDNMRSIISQLSAAAKAGAKAAKEARIGASLELQNVVPDEAVSKQQKDQQILLNGRKLEELEEGLMWLDQLEQLGRLRQTGQEKQEIEMLLQLLENEQVDSLLQELLTTLQADGELMKQLLEGEIDLESRWGEVLHWGSNMHQRAEERWLLREQHWWELVVDRPLVSVRIRTLLDLLKVMMLVVVVFLSLVLGKELAKLIGIAWAVGAALGLVVMVSLVLRMPIYIPGLLRPLARQAQWLRQRRLHQRQCLLLRLAQEQLALKKLEEFSERWHRQQQHAEPQEEWSQTEGERWKRLEELAQALRSELRKQRDLLLIQLEEWEWSLATLEDTLQLWS